MKRFAFLLALSAFTPQPLLAAWGPQGCAPVGRTFTATAPTSEWQEYQGCYYHYTNGVQDAGYDPQTKVFRTYRNGVWSKPLTPPWAKTAKCKCDPCECGDCKCGEHLFGVDTSQLHHDGAPRYSVNGSRVTRAEALAAVQLADDSLKPFVTFIGAGREALAKAFASTPEASKVRVNSYDADAWQVKDSGFKTTGAPTVYVQNAGGEVLYRADSDPGLEKLITEVRKADPSYDPSKDPTGSFNFAQIFKSVPPPVWYVAGLFGALLLFRKKA